MSQSNYITLALFAVIGLVFLIDFIKNNSSKSINESVEKFVKKESETKERSGVLNWILKRKKNISLSLILLPLLKVLTHFVLFPNQIEVVVDNIVAKGDPYDLFSGDDFERIVPIYDQQPMSLGSHFECMFTERLELFIPVTIVFLIVVWFFNDKIKAQ